MVVHLTWVWTFFNNYNNHPRICVLSTLCGNVDKHSPFDIYIYIYIYMYRSVTYIMLYIPEMMWYRRKFISLGYNLRATHFITKSGYTKIDYTPILHFRVWSMSDRYRHRNFCYRPMPYESSKSRMCLAFSPTKSTFPQKIVTVVVEFYWFVTIHVNKEPSNDGCNHVEHSSPLIMTRSHSDDPEFSTKWSLEYCTKNNDYFWIHLIPVFISRHGNQAAA